MRKILKISVIISCLATAIFGVAACGRESVGQISVEQDGMPSRTTFVRGQEPDFFGGTLTVVSKEGETSYIPLDDPEIKLSYDRELIGEVPVTLEYHGATTVLTITVIPRVEFKNINTDYFVGEAFDITVGDVVLNEDTGSSVTYSLDDGAVSFSGFDSSTAGEKQAEIVVGGYREPFSFTVHTFKEKDYGVPRKTDYQSHETEVDLSGGYIQYRSTDDYVRRISLTQEMVSGYEPERATRENRLPGKACSEVITVKFPGFDFETSDRGLEFTYTVDIHYSDVTLIKSCAQAMKDLTFHYDETTGNLQYDEAAVEKASADAAEACMLYAALEAEDRALIGEDEIAWIARPAVVGYFYAFYDAMSAYSDVVLLSGSATQFVLESYQATKRFYEEFSQSDAYEKPIVLMNQFLVSFLSEDGYAELREVDAMTDEEYAGQGGTLSYFFSNVPDFAAFINVYVSAMGEMLKTFDMLNEDVIPRNWTYETLTETQKAAIENFYTHLTTNMTIYPGSYYSGSQSFRVFYTGISNWRTKGDLFDIPLTYYYRIATDEGTSEGIRKDAEDAIYTLCNDFQMPSDMEDLYSDIYNMLREYSLMNQFVNAGYYYETTNFIHIFRNSIKKFEKIKAEEEGLCKYVVDNVELFGVLSQNGFPVSTSLEQIFKTLHDNIYLSYVGDMDQVKGFEDMWEKFDRVIQNFRDGNYVTGGSYNNQFGRDISDLIKTYNALTPAERCGFYQSFSSYSDVTAFTQNQDGSFLTLFGQYVFAYLGDLVGKGQLSEEMYLTIGYLFLAQDFLDAGDIETFLSGMESAVASYDQLSIADRISFDRSDFGAFYQNMNSIRILYTDESHGPELTEEEEALMSDLQDAVAKAMVILTTILQDNDGDSLSDMPIYGVYVAAFEKANEQVEKILAAIEEGENKNLYNVYYYGAYDLLGTGERVRLERVVTMLRSYFTSYLRSIGVSYEGDFVSLYSIYEESGIRDLIKLTADFLLEATLVEEGEVLPDLSEIPLEKVKAIVDGYQDLTNDQKMAFSSMFQAYDYAYDMYLQGLVLYFADSLEYDANNDNNIVFLYYRLQMAYLDYVYTKEYNSDAVEEEREQILKAYESAVENFYSAYEKLTDEVKKKFLDVFRESVESCVEEYQGSAQNPMK